MSTQPGDDARVRVATLNVHGWHDARGEPNHARVVALIREHALDVVGLQEVTTAAVSEQGAPSASALAWVAARLGYHHSGALRRGCGLLSRFPIERRAPVPNYPSAKGAGRDREFVRVLACELALPENSQASAAATLRVLVSHLHHFDPDRRLYQVGVALEHGVFGARPDLWLGDFNALCPADYSAADWAEIAAVRARNRWEPPRGDTVAAIEEAGFVDCWRRAGSEGPVGTCRFGTRVDYIWATPALLSRWPLERCRRIERDHCASDHRAVVATLRRAELDELVR